MNAVLDFVDNPSLKPQDIMNGALSLYDSYKGAKFDDVFQKNEKKLQDLIKGADLSNVDDLRKLLPQIADVAKNIKGVTTGITDLLKNKAVPKAEVEALYAQLASSDNDL